MGFLNFLKRKNKNENKVEEPKLSQGYEQFVIKAPKEDDVQPSIPSFGGTTEVKQEHNTPFVDEYRDFSWALHFAWSDKRNKREKYNYENGIVEEVYDYELLSTPMINMLLEEHKEETEKLIAFYTENKPNEHNLELYEEFMEKYGRRLRVEITDKEYNTLCRYISRYYDERPIGHALAGTLTTYSLSYDSYQNVKPSIEKEINIIMDETIDEAVKESIMREMRLKLHWSLTANKTQFMV